MIHLNQTGFAPNLPKTAVITGKGECCYVVSADNTLTIKPEVSPPFFDEASGDTVRIVDFSEIKKSGTYFLFADGLKKTFYVKNEPYRELTKALVKGMYYQRCGCALEKKHAAPFHHACCHEAKASLINDNSVTKDVSGGWHDAGDYGRYIAPGAVAVSHMLYAFELFPGAFNDELNIPESGNGVPDILNECRYELEWMFKMQRDDGAVHHKVTTRIFAPFIMPEDDKEELLIFDVSHTSTAAFAAVFAQACRVFKKYDEAFSKKSLEASRRAWNWLEANPCFVPFKNPPDVRSGEYGDANGDDELFWAACCLFALTKEERYFKTMRSLADKIDISKLGWRDTGGLGALSCLFTAENLDENFKKVLHEKFLQTADEILLLCNKSGYGTALDGKFYVWGSNLPILNNAIILICAKLLTGDIKYQNAAQAQLDYLLGKNATGYSYVTGFGENAYRFPHHRPSYADGIDDPVPGLVSGGPNKNWQDRTCKELIPEDTAPAKSFIDHTWTASANEIAVYWNSPAIFTASFFYSLSLD